MLMCINADNYAKLGSTDTGTFTLVDIVLGQGSWLELEQRHRV